jgi:hypothetical protein
MSEGLGEPEAHAGLITAPYRHLPVTESVALRLIHGEHHDHSATTLP